MQVMFACVADYATIDQQGGKLSVMGVFDSVFSQSFPAMHAKMVLVVRVMFEHDDNGKKRKMSVRLRDEDHKEYAKIDGEVHCGTVGPGEFGTNNLVVEFNQMAFAKPGRYHFAISLDAGKEFRVPFAVKKA